MNRLDSLHMMFEHGIITADEYEEKLEKYSKQVDRMFDLWKDGRITEEELRNWLNK